MTALLVVSAGAFGATAFTSATIDRNATMNVVSDTNGLIALEDGTSGPLISENTAGALEIDLDSGSGTGVNVNSTYEFGNPSDPVNQTAFNVTNNGDEQHTVNLNYNLTADDGNTADNVQFDVYDASGNLLVTVTEEGTGQSVTLASGGTANVVLVVDTNSGVTSADDLSGTLEVTV